MWVGSREKAAYRRLRRRARTGAGDWSCRASRHVPRCCERRGRTPPLLGTYVDRPEEAQKELGRLADVVRYIVRPADEAALAETGVILGHVVVSSIGAGVLAGLIGHGHPPVVDGVDGRGEEAEDSVDAGPLSPARGMSELEEAAFRRLGGSFHIVPRAVADLGGAGGPGGGEWFRPST